MQKKWMLLVACIFMGLGLLNAQTAKVTGVVTAEEDGFPVVGASVLVKGTSIGTITDIDGQFALANIPEGSTKLVVSYVGMQSQEVAVKPHVNIVLKSDTELLDEVMVVAYGTAKKASFTGSAATVKTGELKKRQVSNVTKAIDGLASGIQATSGSGQPGSGSTIYIRGLGSINASNTPLYVVDGVPYDGSINAINPDDIDGITILKDASAAALYGSRAANGVIMITTKKGNKGSVDVNLKATVGVSSRALPRYETMNSKEFIEASYSAFFNQQIANGTDPSLAGAAALQAMGSGPMRLFGKNEQYNPFNLPIAELIDTQTGLVRPGAKLLWEDDWLDEVTTNAALRQEYALSVNGGSDKAQYMFSLGYLNDKGILETTNFQRYTGRLNVETAPTNWFKAGMGANFAHSTSNFGMSESNVTSNVWFSAMMMAPIFPVYERDRNNNGAFVRDDQGNKLFDYGKYRPSGAQQDFNSIATLYDDKMNNTIDNLSGRAHLDFGGVDHGWSKGLKFVLNFGFDYASTDDLKYYNPYFGNAASVRGRVQKSNTKTLGYTFNQILSYARTFNKHSFDVLLGHEWYAYKKDFFYANKTNLPFGGLTDLDAATTMGSIEGRVDNYRIESYFGRINYDYADKYYLSASFRRDGSSRFHKDHRWGSFWSVGGNYRLSEEEFLKDVDWLSNLAVRASYGLQGNDGLDSYYAWQTLYKLTYPSGNNPGAMVGSISSENISWESNYNLNVGLDVGFFHQRLQVGLEWFQRKTDDMLLFYPLAMSTGFEGYYRNSGSMRNRGFEATINGKIFQTRDFEWDVNLMASTMKNKVLHLTGDGKDILNGDQIIREGEPIYSYYLAQSAGVDPQTGKQLYWATVNEKGEKVKKFKTDKTTLAQASRVVAGSKLPDMFGSLSTQLRYKNLDFSVATNYSIGGEMIDGVYLGMMNFYYPGQAKHKDYKNAWKKPGDITNIPRYELGKTYPTNDDMLINASYFQFKNISLGYTLPENVMKRIKLKSLRLSATVDNVYTFTHLKGMDPQYSLTGGTDFVYAPTRTVSFGVDIKF